MAKIHVDGHGFTVEEGQSLLQACLSLGFDLPYFCWHPAMGSVGACRQCAVKQFTDEQDTRGRMVMACMTPAAEGARISIEDQEAADFRRAVVEGLMLNHPHDCPVCDEGGQCHLQDMTVMTGHDYRRYRFEKRTFRNQYLGPLLNHEMNRCIQCYRCVRFYREYAGGSDLDTFGIGNHVYFGRAQDGVLENAFSGNLAEVCPTGVFTDATLKRHYTRKWDLRWAPSICLHCGLGCNISPGERYGSVRAVVNRYHREINGYFICDRGRYAYEYLESKPRVRGARAAGVAITNGEARTRLRQLVQELRSDPPGRWIGIGSPRASLESNFALRQLVGPERFFAGMAAGELELTRLIIDLLRRGPARTPSLREVEAADAVLILGEDLTESAARMALSVRQASRNQPMREIVDALKIPRWLDHPAREAVQGAHGPVFIATPAATRLDDVSTSVYRAAPADIARLGYQVAEAVRRLGPEPGVSAAPLESAEAMAVALSRAERPLVIAGTGCNSRAIITAAAAVARALHARGRPAGLSFVLPECNTMGLALMQPKPLREGMDMIQFELATSAIVLENDLQRRAPAGEVEAFLGRFDGTRRHLVAIDQLIHSTAAAAGLLLPAASFAEGDGTVVNSEGRAQRFFKLEPSAEVVGDERLAAAEDRAGAAARESWRWILEAQEREATLDEVIEAMCREFPELEGVRNAAPPAAFRLAQQKIPRETHRFSGRTAILANLQVSEPKPPEDPDSALSFTMEGYGGQPPAALTPYFWAPGWNSPQATLRYQNEVNGPLHGGDAGARLIEPGTAGEGEGPDGEMPAAFEPRPGHWLLVRLYHLFGSEPLSSQAPAIASLAPSAYVAMNEADAAAAGLGAGVEVQVKLGDRAYAAPLRIRPELPQGVAGVPAGFAAFDGAGLPRWAEIRAAAGGGA